ncbi:Hypothetical protein NTJ_10172 [Nesidiocoris tenuis]|uniref:Uncharacterized protein n=1 Tax=Nesidiocoris tenuis TaxID=355587 RepID=A0ABN7AZG1_9HEMI|nr:Hypothetical protein NTJ_10172 [Nesidiocoris tenuis]
MSQLEKDLADKGFYVGDRENRKGRWDVRLALNRIKGGVYCLAIRGNRSRLSQIPTGDGLQDEISDLEAIFTLDVHFCFRHGTEKPTLILRYYHMAEDIVPPVLGP